MKKMSMSMVSLLIFGCGTGYAMEEGPERCPSASVVKVVSPQMAIEDRDNGKNSYSAFVVDGYGTGFKWNLVISGIKAESSKEALDKATDALSTLSGNPPPFQLGDFWFCYYAIGKGYKAVAFEPGFLDATKAVKIARR